MKKKKRIPVNIIAVDDNKLHFRTIERALDDIFVEYNQFIFIPRLHTIEARLVGRDGRLNIDEILKKISETNSYPCLAIIDLRLRGDEPDDRSGIGLIKQIKLKYNKCRIILDSAYVSLLKSGSYTGLIDELVDRVDEKYIYNLRKKCKEQILAYIKDPCPVKVFISYSRKDKKYRDELLKYLKPLELSGKIKYWHDRLIEPGKDWNKEINDQINTADIVLLLISADFINSEYCYGVECSRALERQKYDKAFIIPVILRSAYLRDLPISGLQFLPRDGKPLNEYKNRDKVFVDIVDEINKVVDRLLGLDNSMISSGSVRF